MTTQLPFDFVQALFEDHFQFISFCYRYAGMTSDPSIVRTVRSMHSQLLDLKNYAYLNDIIGFDLYLSITTVTSNSLDQFWGHI